MISNSKLAMGGQFRTIQPLKSTLVFSTSVDAPGPRRPLEVGRGSIWKGIKSTKTDNSSTAEPSFNYLENSLAKLLEAAKHEFEHDPDAAKASLAKASSILRSEIARRSRATGPVMGGLAGWQVARVGAFIDNNLHRTIDTRELSTVAQLSAAHFARSFKRSFGEPPHAYVTRRRLEKACRLMITSSNSLSQIALSAGFSDQSHLCKCFKRAFGERPSNWRREREIS